MAGKLLWLRGVGYPLRFPGTDSLAGAAFEDGGVQLPGRFTYEVTVRTVEARFLLRPDAEATEIILGCLGRAAHRYPKLGLHVVSVLSNHITLLATPDWFATLSSFMRDFEQTVTNKLNPLRGREGPMWARRFRAIPAVDEAAVEARFAYVLTQGIKENLVWRAEEWPGVQSVTALCGGKPLVGRWRDGTAESRLKHRILRKQERARRRGEEVPEGEPEVPRLYREYVIELVPLPHWRDEKPGTLRQRVARIARAAADEARARHRREGTQPLGRAAILAADPFGRPEKPKRSPAPLCHASTRAGTRAYRRAYEAWAERVAVANAALSERRAEAGHPASIMIGPLPATVVVKRRDAGEAAFVGGDPRGNVGPGMLPRPRDTGPPSERAPRRR